MVQIRFYILSFLAFISFALSASNSLYHIQSTQDIVHIFPKTTSEMALFKEISLKEGVNQLKLIREEVQNEASFETVLSKLDELLTYLKMRQSIAEAMTLVVPDAGLRDEALSAELSIKDLNGDIFINETSLYHFLKKNCSSAQLPLEKQNFIEDIFFKFESNGQNLPFNERLKVQKLNKEISKLEQLFNQNIREDNSQFLVNKNDLEGVETEIFSHLQENENGLIQLNCSTPLYLSVMSTCVRESTRKKYAEVRANRAFPTNETVLNDLINKRDELASLIGYPSYAHLRLKSEMSKKPETAASFLSEIWKHSAPKELAEFNAVIAGLPKNIHLNSKGQLNSWDASYSFNNYKQRAFALNQDEIAEYFPIESTFSGLMDIYQQFFNINIVEEPISGLWHKDVKLMKVSEKNNDLLGYILLDMYPRENKYGHACDIPVIPGPIVNGKKYPTLEIVVVNFPKGTEKKPALLKHGSVQTFFHEFGHAIHSLFIRSETLYFSNLNNVKYDFVELPSQLLEEWLWNPEILRKLSSHYKTGVPLPDSLINKIVNSQNALSGYFVQSQCYLSFLALNLFSEGKNKNPMDITRELKAHLLPNYHSSNNGHFYLSFDHLTEYGPTYYGYLWSKVYSLDIFEKIKSEGLLNPSIGEKYRREILEKGGAIDPNILLRNFLGRAPNHQAFIKSMDL